MIHFLFSLKTKTICSFRNQISQGIYYYTFLHRNEVIKLQRMVFKSNHSCRKRQKPYRFLFYFELEIGFAPGLKMTYETMVKRTKETSDFNGEFRHFIILLLFFDHAHSRTFQTCSIFLSKNSANNNFDSQVFWTFSQKNLQVSHEICFF